MPTRIFLLALLMLWATAGLAQDSTPQRGWRKVEQPPPAAVPGAGTALDAFGNPRTEQRVPAATEGGIPAQLIVKPGTFLTVRVNQPLSSDYSQPGDAFSATLVRPLVVDGVVVAQAGQIVEGRVAEAVPAGRAKGTSRLGVELTELTLVDGQQVPVRSQLISRSGPTSVGRDAGAVAATTATGAAIGAAADWGRGAAIGAGVGAAAGVIGVLLTRGRPTILDPEAVITFRIEDSFAISTVRAPRAFRYVESADYNRSPELRVRARRPPPPPAVVYYGPAYWPPVYYYRPLYVGPAFFWGPGYYRGWRRW